MLHLVTRALAIAAIVCVGAGAARGVDGDLAGPTRPPPPRVIHVPTAHLQPSLTVFSSAGATQSGVGLASITTGLGQLAEVAVRVDDDASVCGGCTADEPHARALVVANAQFKVGVNEGRAAPWQPALALGFRRSIGEPLGAGGSPDYDTMAVARLFGAASKTLGPLDVHVGVEVWDASVTLGGRTTFLHERPVAERVRPFLGLAFTSPQTPRTTLIADVAWTPFIAAGESSLRYITGVGVRYQAFGWASIELATRHRQGDALKHTTFMVRINAVVPAP